MQLQYPPPASTGTSGLQLVIDVILPISTFMLGFLLGFLKDAIDKRRQRKNIKNIVAIEIEHNLTILCIIFEKYFVPNFDIINFIGSFKADTKISHEIYKEYLGQFSLLNETEIQDILFAYVSLNAAESSMNKVARGVALSKGTENPEDFSEEVCELSDLLKDALIHAIKHNYFTRKQLINEKVTDFKDLDIDLILSNV